MNIKTVNKDKAIINVIVPDSEHDKVTDDVLKHVKLPKYKTVIKWARASKIKCITK